MEAAGARSQAKAALILGALGVVFGDIGTSPIYTIQSRTKYLLAVVGVFGAALFFGDSMITPAISVLSAVEGIQVIEPSLDSLVVPITATIIVVLFVSQRFGTAIVARVFGPSCWSGSRRSGSWESRGSPSTPAC